MRRAIACSVTTLAVTLGGLAYVAAPADAGDGNLFVGVSKQPNGEYHNNVTPTIKRGQVKTFYYEVINVSTDDLEVSLRGLTEGPFRAKWFKGVNGSQNVTAAIAADDYTINTKSGQVMRFRWRVKRVGGPDPGMGCSAIEARWLAETDPNGIFINGTPGGCFFP